MQFREIRKKVEYYPYYDINTMSKPQIMDAERSCTRAIKECEELIAYLQETRLELSKRFQSLETTPSHIRVTLKRQRGYNNKIRYFMETHRVYDDGTTEKLDHKIYPGAERAAVLKEFKQMQKDKPHQEYVLDIEKGKWEK